MKKNRKRKDGIRILILSWSMVLLFVFFQAGKEQQVSADLVYYDAYTFYQQYGREAVFFPTSDTDGLICFATVAGTSKNQSTSFSTEGWEVEFRDLSGAVLQRIRLKLGGMYLTLLDEIGYRGDEYRVYQISLADLKALRNASVASAMDQGKCRLVLNACMVVKENGVAGGRMGADGTLYGTVYTTLSGIRSAAGWSADNRTKLASYFGKEIKGLFHEITLIGDEGISKLEGQGQYCYGSNAQISAGLQEHYEFQGWFTDPSSELPVETENAFTVRANSNQTFYARSATNEPPQLDVADCYYSLSDAQEGRITEDEIRKYIAAKDLEDGILEKEQISIKGFDQTILQKAKDGDIILLQITAEDSDGNKVSKEMKLTLAEASLHKRNRAGGDLRFISPAYPDSLMEDSIWRRNPDYVKLLEQVGIFPE